METKLYQRWQLAGLLSCLLLCGCSGGCQRESSPGPAPGAATPPLTVAFSAEVECTGGEVKYHWDFGDGTTSQEPSPQHTYTKAGDYVATLTVTAGTASASDEIDITVEEGAPAEE